MRSFLRALFGLVLRIFFRRIEIVGRERVPDGGPLLVVLNHPNGLVDPLFMLCHAPRPAAFLAKAPILRMPILGAIARALDAIPVHRPQDAGSDLERNRETFARAREVLARGGAIVLFPEGASHSEPSLRPLKTGGARIALGAAATMGEASSGTLRIVPAGLYYTAKGTFRSEALLIYGNPIAVEPAPLGEDGEPAREAARALTARIEESLRALTLEADSRETLALVARAEQIFTSAQSTGALSLADELERRRRFLVGYGKLRADEPAVLKVLEARIDALDAKLSARGLLPASLPALGFRAREILWVGCKSALFLALLGPVALVGTCVHYPPYRLVGTIAMRIAAREDDILSTVKMLGAVVFFPLTWLALGIFAGLRWSPRWGLATALVAPLCGQAALTFWERWGELKAGARAVWFSVREPAGFEALLAERRTLEQDIARVRNRLGISPTLSA